MYLALSKVIRMVGSVSYERGVTAVVDQFCMKRGRPVEKVRERREKEGRRKNLNNASLTKEKTAQNRFANRVPKICDMHVTSY